MSSDIYKKIFELVAKAQTLANSVGIDNLLQPGLVKEIIVAEILGHTVITSKRDADACDRHNPAIKYEYLTCKEGGTGQLDRMFREPPEKREDSLARITRNRKVYFAVFFKSNQLKVKVIYELSPALVVRETRLKLDRSSNSISHVGFSTKWAAENGRVVYQDASLSTS